MKRKRVIVTTGGPGVIGSHLVEKLVEDNEVVIIVTSPQGSLKTSLI